MTRTIVSLGIVGVAVAVAMSLGGVSVGQPTA